MHVRLITLRFDSALSGFDERPLDTFLRDVEVLAIREHFFVVHDQPFLACLVSYQRPSSVPSPAPSTPFQRRSGPDPTADLDRAEREIFERLRGWRAAQARKDGVPPYVLFTNRELVAILRARPTSLAALGAVPGIGSGKLDRHGKSLLGLLPSEWVTGVTDQPPHSEPVP